MSHTFDIVIIGGGVVGLTTALALAQKTSLTIALIDTKKLSPEWKKENYDFRVSAISLASQHIFENLGVWDAIKFKRVSAYEKMQVWDESSGTIEFDCEKIGAKSLGHIIEEAVIRSSLLEMIMTQKNIFLYDDINVVSIEKNIESVVVKTQEKELECKLLIAADGGNSWVREQMGISINQMDYQHTAIVCNVQTEFSHEYTAKQKFLNSGPLAFLPLSDTHTCSIVWSVPQSEADLLLTQSDEDFCVSLTNAGIHSLGKILSTTQRYSFPLRMRHAESYVQTRLALVGDAAHTIHPLAGQGVNMGLLDAACLVDVITTALNKHRDYTSLATLRRYERFRKSDNALMLNAVAGFKKIFSSQAKPLTTCRNLGLALINKSDFLKNKFMRHAMGLRDEMPTLTLCQKNNWNF
ncbi:MAG: UbiH/UbiF/VisC/COQ6 family ubiquinone biosynthesis hydroxylase [Gammaproteobacteria bacterium]|nr:UbiH/UbiF/VisC/COQ6 family ubiquinone biosynthesis hydroxylase [Gammaproteobacteria bacterium]